MSQTRRERLLRICRKQPHLGDLPLRVEELHHLHPHQVRPAPPPHPRHPQVDHVRVRPRRRGARRDGGAEGLVEEAAEVVEGEEGDGGVVGGEAGEHLLLVHARDGRNAGVEHHVDAPLRGTKEATQSNYGN